MIPNRLVTPKKTCGPDKTSRTNGRSLALYQNNRRKELPTDGKTQEQNEKYEWRGMRGRKNASMRSQLRKKTVRDWRTVRKAAQTQSA